MHDGIPIGGIKIRGDLWASMGPCSMLIRLDPGGRIRGYGPIETISTLKFLTIVVDDVCTERLVRDSENVTFILVGTADRCQKNNIAIVGNLNTDSTSSIHLQ